MEEEWRPIQGYKNYEVSSCGNVRNVKFNRNLKQATHTTLGYRYLNLSKDGKCKSFYVHRLVAQAFIEKPEDKDWVLHKDGTRYNNTIDNLYWGTPKDNTADSKAHGTRCVGKKSPFAKLTEEHIRTIWEGVIQGDSNAKIAQGVPVNASRISEIRRFKAYSEESRECLKLMLDKTVIRG